MTGDLEGGASPYTRCICVWSLLFTFLVMECMKTAALVYVVRM